ncbi:hypothetical protein GWG65_23370 [Bradyrhizobium sp. CSA207]|uniref:hypothetical protein n=1 Tax=Bradyrhizobium sp. CSA207 TaxID=2698826 RepID=UPI0023AF70EE|nr:hypothetical protein [Bradyrhizobium sp. CSA207]MDE5444335.1 hypothetical protein [Bradyrhizobium sp. CSA207]
MTEADASTSDWIARELIAKPQTGRTLCPADATTQRTKIFIQKSLCGFGDSIQLAPQSMIGIVAEASHAMPSRIGHGGARPNGLPRASPT